MSGKVSKPFFHLKCGQKIYESHQPSGYHDDIYQHVRICEICQDMPEYSRIFQDMLGFVRIFQDMLG